MNGKQPVLDMRGIEKAFPGIRALKEVDFRLFPGEVHALMGENGAGKSTLIKVMTGVYPIDRGEMTLHGRTVAVESPLHAQELGISTVYQEVNLCGNLTVAENIMLGREPKKRGRIDWKRMNQLAYERLAALNLNIDVRRHLSAYSVAIQQMVAIARALQVSAKVLILDEPTSSLDVQEVEQLFAVMRQLKEEGMAILFVTHFLDQVYAISDRITVLRNGHFIGEYLTEQLSRIELVSCMIGKEMDELKRVEHRSVQAQESSDHAPVWLQANQLAKKGSIHPFDLEIRSGEVLGLAGLLGAGRTEIARLLFGADKADQGSMVVNGKNVAMSSPRQAIASGIAFCSEDRKAEGIIDELSVRENMMLAMQAMRGWYRSLPIDQQRELVDQYIRLLNINPPNPDVLMKHLSGGNQQKVLLARWLLLSPELLILDEPTRGIDVGAKAEIQKLIVSLSEQGKSLLFISAELEEVIRCSHRIAVIRDRRKVREFDHEHLNYNDMMEAIAGEEGV